MDCEKNLLSLCIEGKEHAWDELLKRYSRAVYRVMKTFDLTCEEEADIYQQIFFGLYKDNCRKLKSFQGKCSFSTWISVVTRRECLNYLRSKKTRFNLLGKLKEENISNPYERVEDRDLLNKLFEELTSRERLLLKLYYVKELSCREISEITGITENTIYSIIHRSLEKIRKYA